MSVIRMNSREVIYLSERDWRLKHLMQAVGDLEYRRADSAFHSLAHSIIEQMLSMKAGQVIEGRLLELGDGELEAARIAALSPEAIKACGMSMRKAQNLRALAEYALENDLEAMGNLSDAEISSELQKLPGIGKWTTDMFLLFYLERPDVLPVEDGAVKQVFKWLYEAPITSPEVQFVVCSLWQPYSSTAVRYLYRALNTGLVRNNGSSSFLWSR